MEPIRYIEYRNQYPDELDDDVFEALLDHDPEIMHGYDYPTPVAEFALRAVRRRHDWPDAVADWERAATHWIPPQVQSWWFKQFDDNPGMDDMAAEWWQTQPLGVIAAWYGDQPVGVVSLTRILSRDRGLTGAPDRPLFNEIRGLVVDPQFRASGYKIGTQLVQRVVEMGNQLQDGRDPLATMAITSNPLAAQAFRASGAVSDPAAVGIPATLKGIRAAACWRQWQSHNWPETSRCNNCPIRDDRLWLWPAKAAESIDDAAQDVVQ